MSGPWVLPWDADLESILRKLNERGVDVRTDLGLDLLREAMVEAWQFGYTNGMADADRLDRRGMGFLRPAPHQAEQ